MPARLARIRLAGAVAVAAAVTVGASGCTFLVPHATTIKYDAADGRSADLDGIAIRGALVIVNEDGTTGNLLLSATNTSDAPVDLTIQYVDGSGQRLTGSQTLPAGLSTKFGFDNFPQIDLGDMPVPAGADIPIYFQAGTTSGVELDVPVLATDWEQYEDLAPVVPEPTDEPSTEDGAEG